MGNLIIGPTSVGKSTFIRHKISLDANKVILGYEVPLKGVPFGTDFVHYNLLEPWNTDGVFLDVRAQLRSESTLYEILESGVIDRVTVLVVSERMLRSRISAREHVEPRLRPDEPITYFPDQWLRVLENVDLYGIYEELFSYLDDRGISHVCVASIGMDPDTPSFMEVDRLSVRQVLRGNIPLHLAPPVGVDEPLVLNETDQRLGLNLTAKHLGSDIPYVDGAEDEIVRIIEGSVDRSSTSDELAAQVHDWPTLYHLSPLRAHLLTPLCFKEDARILEVGCGTGVNVRVLAERGHSVVGLEGHRERALAARLRTAEFPNVEIVAGDFADFHANELFDVILVIGVLEYTTAGLGAIDSPKAFLDRCRSFLKPDGVLVLAIENQLGLKYLLSYPEDHLGVPWLGLEGYRPETPRTWSRLALRNILSESGFLEQQWLHPFPDYKLPTFICREEVYASDEGQEIVTKFVRQPVGDHSGSPWLVCDAQRAHQELIHAGLGVDVPNSFLIVASETQAACQSVVDDAEAWMVSGHRRSAFRSTRRLLRSGDSWMVVPRQGPSSENPATRAWLSNRGHASEQVIQGTPLEDLIVSAIEREDAVRLSALVKSYWDYLVKRVVAGVDSPPRAENPFTLTNESQHVGGDLLDCVPQNLIADRSGDLHSVDHEWVADGTCSLKMIFLRGLLTTCRRLHQQGARLAFVNAADSSVADLMTSLARLGNVSVPYGAVEVLLKAEYQLQSLVALAPIGDEKLYRSMVMESTPVVRQRPSLLELLRISEQRDRVLGELSGVVGERDRLADELASVVSERDRLAGELASVVGERDHLMQGTDHLRREVEALRRSRAYRSGRVFTAPITWLTRPFRR
jgi:2-polyprenyl-3-methyl-5-hydroxy-6-metoxy-1,4-benzoquinol methylase